MMFMLFGYVRFFLFSFFLLWIVSYSYAFRYTEAEVLFHKNSDDSQENVLFKAKALFYSLYILDDGFYFIPSGRGNFLDQSSDNQHMFNVRFLNIENSRRLTSERESGASIELRRIEFKDVWSGVDLVYYDKQGEVEYDFIVAPGVDPSVIKFQLENFSNVYLDASGNLVVDLLSGKFIQKKPFAYQEVNTKDGVYKKEVISSYQLDEKGQVAFNLDDYDKRLPLIIDPVISFSSFLGGKEEDLGKAIGLDSFGNIVVVGDTKSPDFPSYNAIDGRLARGDQDIFVSKFSENGKELIFSTYIGGKTGIEKASGLAVDKIGNIYITGTTTGTDFPVTPLAYQTTVADGEHAFVVKLDQSGRLIYASYIEGASSPSIAVNNMGQVLLAGSASEEFKTTTNAFQSSIPFGKTSSAFVLKLNEKGNDVVFSTFVSGEGVDSIKDIDVDARGNVYLVGETDSKLFPLQKAFQNNLKGDSDGFVVKMDASGSVLLYSTYLGGSDKDIINAIKLDVNENLYLVGETFSSDYPVKYAFQSKKSGSYLRNSILGNAFVSKLSSTGDSLRFSSFLGGEVCYPEFCEPLFNQTRYSGDEAIDVQIDEGGHAYIIGLARSYTFPLVNSVVAMKQNDTEKSLFVSKVSESGSVILYSTLIHVSEQAASAMRFNQAAIDDQGGIYVTGSYDATFKASDFAWQNNYAGGYYDAIFMKLTSHEPDLSISSSKNPVNKSELFTLNALMKDANDGDVISFWDQHLKLGDATLKNGIASIDINLSAGVHQIIAIHQNEGSEGDSSPIYQLVNPDPSCQ